MSNILPGSKAVVTPTGEDLVFITQGGNPRNAKLSKLGEVLLGNEELNNDKSIKKNINDINNDIGSEEMGTTATNIKGAIKEINDTIGIINVENDGNIATQIEEINSSLKDNTQNINNLKNNKQDKLEDSGWISIPLAEGVNNYDNAEYRKIGKQFELSGRVNGISGTNGTIGTLPSGFRPHKAEIFLCSLKYGRNAMVSVSTSGVITIYAENAITADDFICLSNVRYSI